MFSEIRKRAKKAGQPPGTLTYTGDKKNIIPEITITTYSQSDYQTTTSAKFEPPEPKEDETIWINVDGLNDVALIKEVAKHFHLHPLTVEDILNVDQRSKVEEFDGYMFITLKMIFWKPNTNELAIDQLSLVLGKNFVISFQEHKTDMFASVQKRLGSTPHQRLRQQGGDYLIYRLIDVVVDQYFIVLEALGDLIEKIEERVISTPTPHSARSIYHLKRQMLLLRKAIWPMREAVSRLLRVEDELVSNFTRLYLRDVYDHTVQAVDTLETFRDMLSSMLDMYLSSMTNRMNEIMKTLTIIATIFIPITSIASIYGMNFLYMPELRWHYGYPAVLVVMAIVAVLMLIYFRSKKWI